MPRITIDPSVDSFIQKPHSHCLVVESKEAGDVLIAHLRIPGSIWEKAEHQITKDIRALLKEEAAKENSDGQTYAQALLDRLPMHLTIDPSVDSFIREPSLYCLAVESEDTLIAHSRIPKSVWMTAAHQITRDIRTILTKQATEGKLYAQQLLKHLPRPTIFPVLPDLPDPLDDEMKLDLFGEIKVSEAPVMHDEMELEEVHEVPLTKEEEVERKLQKWCKEDFSEDARTARERILNAFRKEETRLDLSDLDLSSLPDVLGDCTSVEVLDISNNPLLTSIPKEIGNLKNLRILNAEFCNLQVVPLELGECTKLEEIYLQWNEMFKNFPKLESSSRVKVIDVSSTNVNPLHLVHLPFSAKVIARDLEALKEGEKLSNRKIHELTNSIMNIRIRSVNKQGPSFAIYPDPKA